MPPTTRLPKKISFLDGQPSQLWDDAQSACHGAKTARCAFTAKQTPNQHTVVGDPSDEKRNHHERHKRPMGD